MFSDPGNGIAEQFGIVHVLDGMAGISEPRPTVYVIDPDGLVSYAWVAREWPSFPDYETVEAIIQED